MYILLLVTSWLTFMSLYIAAQRMIEKRKKHVCETTCGCSNHCSNHCECNNHFPLIECGPNYTGKPLNPFRFTQSPYKPCHVASGQQFFIL